MRARVALRHGVATEMGARPPTHALPSRIPRGFGAKRWRAMYGQVLGASVSSSLATPASSSSASILVLELLS